MQLETRIQGTVCSAVVHHLCQKDENVLDHKFVVKVKVRLRVASAQTVPTVPFAVVHHPSQKDKCVLDPKFAMWVTKSVVDQHRHSTVPQRVFLVGVLVESRSVRQSVLKFLMNGARAIVVTPLPFVLQHIAQQTACKRCSDDAAKRSRIECQPSIQWLIHTIAQGRQHKLYPGAKLAAL